VEARFDVLPPLPAPSGILGAVGIVDRPPAAGDLVGVTKTGEIRDLLGPGTLGSMPEVAHALANGTSEAVISPVAGGRPASVTLMNAQSEGVLLLRARSNGSAGNTLRAEVRTVTNANNDIIRVTLRLRRDNRLLETFADLQVAPDSRTICSTPLTANRATSSLWTQALRMFVRVPAPTRLRSRRHKFRCSNPRRARAR